MEKLLKTLIEMHNNKNIEKEITMEWSFEGLGETTRGIQMVRFCGPQLGWDCDFVQFVVPKLPLFSTLSIEIFILQFLIKCAML